MCGGSSWLRIIFLNCDSFLCLLQVVRTPEGTEGLEELPGDHVNMAVQVRGGPSDHETTSWILVSVSGHWVLSTNHLCLPTTSYTFKAVP